MQPADKQAMLFFVSVASARSPSRASVLLTANENENEHCVLALLRQARYQRKVDAVSAHRQSKTEQLNCLNCTALHCALRVHVRFFICYQHYQCLRVWLFV